MQDETMIKNKEKVNDNIKYCSDYDETCHEIFDPMRCFLGGLWTCKNGHTTNMDMADGVCKIMENKR